ncbi:MAG: M20/M25/M40 family metallo-hydrolase [Pseudoflavonifractor sp.]|nr:M20/M25/M40 family metallo-hydrolase [Alloprevotella sp.]MCM1117248.1 M20/M25/M40 family metallo-hydrolase [Pseudoflavonifractor sp.]
MTDQAIELLKKLIATPSLSGNEAATADIIAEWLAQRGVEPQRIHNNVWALASNYDPSRPTLLLNSHHDTVKPSPSYTRNPFSPDVEHGRLYGLGSNDAGASGVSLASAFVALKDEPLPVNLLFAWTASEENMAPEGMRAFLPEMASRGISIDMALVGEPTGMRAAIAERGLMVLDGMTIGKAGHAARNEGINALYLAIEAINRLREFSPEKVSPILGPVRVSITMIQAGTQHNVVPDQCKFVVDVRTTDAYTNEETAVMLQEMAGCSLTPRSTRIHASVIDQDHPLVRAAKALERDTFISPTTSDMALMHGIPSLKMGPGDSARSHTADEYILLSEIEEAIPTYIQLIRHISL